MSKKSKFLRCSLCNKEVWVDMYVLHLRNVHNYDLAGAHEKAHSDLQRLPFQVDGKRAKRRKKEIHSSSPFIKEPPKQRQLTRKIISQNDCKTYHFIWQDVVFKTHEIQIIIKRIGKRFIPIESKNSIEALNKIREEFFLKHHGHKLYKLLAYDQKIMLEWSPDVKEILSIIDSSIEFYNFRYEKNTTRILSENFLRTWSNEQILKLFSIKAEKEPYLNFLYKKHSEEFKLIPILEFIGNSEEESFLFRIRNKKEELLIVWENLNPARATYFFKVTQTNSMFGNILHYIVEHRPAKRSFLRNQRNLKWANEELGYVGFIEHGDFDNYKRSIHKLI